MTDTPPREPRAEAAIMDAARNVLATAGYRGFTIEAVAARAGVDPAMIERWWTGKDDLLVDVLAEAMAIEEIPDVGDSRGELSLAVERMIGFYTDRQRFEPALLGFAADCAGAPAVTEQLRKRCIRRSRHNVGAALRRAAARGDLPPDIDTDLIQDVWAGTIAYRRLISGGTITMELVEPLLDLVLSGMAPLRAPEWTGGRRPDEPWPWWLQESAAWLWEVAFGRVCKLTDGVPVRALAAVPATAVVAAHPVTISTCVWRDFMPSGDPNSSALIVFVMVTAAGPGVLPPFLRADRVAVLHSDEVWVAPLVEEDLRSRTSRKFEVAARRGPMWEPGTSVDIVVQLQGADGDLQLVRVPNQRIGETS